MIGNIPDDTLLISICIPAFRAEKYLQETLESVAAQTWKRWEMIVVEDGSQDATESIVQEFARTVSQKVIYQRQTKNAGLSKTRNVANRLASGNYMAFLDADDLWLPNHLASCMKALEQHSNSTELLLVFSGCVIFDSDSGAFLEHRTPTPAQWSDFSSSLHRGEIIIQPSSVVITRQALEKTGDFDASFPICNDLEYWFRAQQNGVKILFTGEESTLYRNTPRRCLVKART